MNRLLVNPALMLLVWLAWSVWSRSNSVAKRLHAMKARLDLIILVLMLTAVHTPAEGWGNAAGNLAGLSSECGNMCRLFPVPNTDKVIAGIAGARDRANEYSSVVWFDEFDFKLGPATTKPPEAGWSNGVWRRDFANGIALVNPTREPVTVKLELGFRRLRGQQAPEVNNGAIVTSLTMKTKDGIILQKGNL